VTGVPTDEEVEKLGEELKELNAKAPAAETTSDNQ